LKLKLNLMEKQKVTQVNKLTDCVHNLVRVEKKYGSLRLCLDPSELNKTVEWERYLPWVSNLLSMCQEGVQGDCILASSFV